MKIIQNNTEEGYIEENKKPFDPVKFFLKNLHYAPFILLSIIIALTLAFLINESTPPIYQVSSKFYVKEDVNSAGILDLTRLTKGNYNNQTQKLSNEAVFLLSKPLAELTLDVLDFRVAYYEPGFFVDTELYKNSPVHVEVDWGHPQIIGGKMDLSWSDPNSFVLRFPEKTYFQNFPDSKPEVEIDLSEIPVKKYKFDEWVSLPFVKFKVTFKGNEPVGNTRIKFNSKSGLLAKYTGEDLQVVPVELTSSVLGLTLNTSHPEKGSDYLNTLMEISLEEELNEKNRMAKSTVDFIDRQISGVADTLSFFEGRLQNFRSSNRTYNIASESNVVYGEITDLEKQLSQESFKKQYYQNLQNYLVRETYDQIIMPAGLGIEDPILNSLIQNLITLQNEKSRLLSMQTQASPRVRDVTNKITDINASLSEVVRNVTSNTDFLIRDLQERISKIERQFSRLPSTEQNLLKIQREFTLNETIYTFLLQRRAESAIAMASNTSSNKVVEYAAPNYIPITVKSITIYIVALVGGFVFPIGMIMLITVFDRKIKDVKELEDRLIAPVLAKIGRSKSKSSLSVFSEPKSAMTESFRSLKTNISFIVPNDKHVAIAVSSSVSKEGKTFTAINLASVYSLNDKKTILVSCDMYKPNTFRDFGLKGKQGLSNYLSRQIDVVFDIIQPSGYPLLDVIASGSIPPNPSELIALPRFKELLEDLKKIYDVVILDTPPVGLISQSFEIMKNVDVILYVLRYKYSEWSFADDLNNIKIKKGIRNIYSVINDVGNQELHYKGYSGDYYDSSKAKKSFVGNIFKRGKAAL